MVAALVTFFVLSPFAVVAAALRKESEVLIKRLVRDAGLASTVTVDQPHNEIVFIDAQPHVHLTFSTDAQLARLRIERALVGRAAFTVHGASLRCVDDARALLESEPVRAQLDAVKAWRELRLLDDGALAVTVMQLILEPQVDHRAPPKVREVTMADLHEAAGALRKLASLLAPLPVVRELSTSSPSGAPVPAPR